MNDNPPQSLASSTSSFGLLLASFAMRRSCAVALKDQRRTKIQKRSITIVCRLSIINTYYLLIEFESNLFPYHERRNQNKA
jgi:hypothetical protein